MWKLLLGCLVLGIVAIGGALLVLSATGGISVYGKKALALSIVVIIIVGIALIIVVWSHSRRPH
jgi:hypothetical protein